MANTPICAPLLLKSSKHAATVFLCSHLECAVVHAGRQSSLLFTRYNVHLFSGVRSLPLAVSQNEKRRKGKTEGQR